MKKLIFLLCLFCLIFGTICCHATTTKDDILVYLNGNRLQFDVAPCIINGRTMVPFRGIFEALGASVSWDDETRSATGISDTKTVVFTVDNYAYTVNFIPYPLDVAPCIMNSRTLIPLRAVSESMDCIVDWHAEYRSVTIATPDWDSTGWTVPRPEYMYTEEELLNKTSNFFEMNAYYEKQNQKTDYLDLVSVYDSSASFYFDGEPIVFSTPAKVINGRTIVPLEEMMAFLGATISTDDETDNILIVKDSVYITLTLGSNSMDHAGVVSKLEIPVLSLEDIIYIPLDVVQSMAYAIGWDASKNAVVISSPALITDSISNEYAYFSPEVLVPDPSSLWSFTSVKKDESFSLLRYPAEEFTDDRVSAYIAILEKSGFKEKFGRPGVYESTTHSVQLSTIIDGASYFQIAITPLQVYNKYSNTTLAYYAEFPSIPDFGINCGVNGGTFTQGSPSQYTYMVKANQEMLLTEYAEMLCSGGFKAISPSCFTKTEGETQIIVLCTTENNRVIISIIQQKITE